MTVRPWRVGGQLSPTHLQRLSIPLGTSGPTFSFYIHFTVLYNSIHFCLFSAVGWSMAQCHLCMNCGLMDMERKYSSCATFYLLLDDFTPPMTRLASPSTGQSIFTFFLFRETCIDRLGLSILIDVSDSSCFKLGTIVSTKIVPFVGR